MPEESNPLNQAGQHLSLPLFIFIWFWTCVDGCVRSCAHYRRRRSILAERSSEDSLNAPVVSIAEMSRTDDQVTSHVCPGWRCCLNSSLGDQQAGKCRLASQQQQWLPPPEKKRPAAIGRWRTRAPLLLDLRVALAAHSSCSYWGGGGSPEHLGGLANQSTCCSEEAALKGWLKMFFLKDNFLGPPGNQTPPPPSPAPCRRSG